MKLFYYIKRFWEIPGVEKKLIVKGIFVSSIIYIIVHIFPFRSYLPQIIKSPNSKSKIIDKGSIIKSIFKTINRINRFVPWKCTCLINAITFKLLLKSYGIGSNLVLGIIKPTRSIVEAHAQLIIEDEIVYLNRNNLIKLGCF